MDTAELLKKIRVIEIKTRQISSQLFSGSYHSKFKGRGMSFRENREYTMGDDIRSINWNVTAKMNTPYTKVFEEERELSALLLVDVSASTYTGSGLQSKKNLITEISAVLAMSAIQNKDKVGVLFFSDKPEKFIPPGTGKSHVLKIIRELLQFQPVAKQTNIDAALSYAGRMVKKRSIFFLISDFKAKGYESSLSRINLRHNLTAIQIKDKREESISDVGMVKFTDPETGKEKWVNTSLKKTRKKLELLDRNFQEQTNTLLKKSGVKSICLYTNQPYHKSLIKLFERV